MWELNCEEGWAPENWCFWTVVLEKTLESPLDCKKIQPVHSEGDQTQIFIGRTDAEAKTPILWPPEWKTDSLEKTDAEQDWKQGEKEMATQSSIIAWRIPWTEEPGGLQCTGSKRVGLDWATSLSLSPLVLDLYFMLAPSWITALSWQTGLCNSVKLTTTLCWIKFLYHSYFLLLWFETCRLSF